MSRRSSKINVWDIASRPSPASLIVMLLGILLCILAWIWQYRSEPQSAVPQTASAAVRLNELMSSNKSALHDDKGEYSDWIELMNTSSEPVDITGWKLSDGSSLFTFPKHILGAGETIIVYASGSIHALPGEVCHAPFKLSSSGETVTLSDSLEVTVDSVELPALDADSSYARNADGSWAQTLAYTPGLPNDSIYTPMQDTVLDTGLVISEVMPKNVSYAPDADGDCSDYIELYNGSGKAVSLKGYMLSDNESSRDKYIFPDVTIQPGEYLLIYASGKERRAADTAELHAPFSLSKNGETILLCNEKGQLLSRMSFEETEADICHSLNPFGRYVSSLAPTPRFSNDADGAARLEAALQALNSERVIISEVLASTRMVNDDADASYDWAELYNGSASAVDLSGWALSDTASHPRKWQFPEGTTIAPGEYMLVYLSGKDTVMNGRCHTSFSLSSSAGESMVLCRPDGTIVDRLPSGNYHAEISVGRIDGLSGFVLFETATPGARNSGSYYADRAETVQFSQNGGIQNQPFMLTLTAGEGEQIYYTTDSSTPSKSSTLYTAPISVDSTTVVRAVAVRNGYMDSIPTTRTYLFGISHTLPVISLVSDPDDMFGGDKGMYSNKNSTWAVDSHIEYFTLEGETLFSQGAEISLHGNDARNYQQKTMNVVARSKYGDNRFRASIFPNREYTEYQSFLLRPSSEDCNYTRMRCSILSTLAEGTSVLYQDVVVGVLYINGEYWGHYNLRERVNAHAIAQWEGWSDPDRIDLVKGNADTMQGSNSTFRDLLSWLKKNDIKTQADIDYVNSIVDIENYLDYVMLEMYVGNSDLMNVKRYRSEEGDGRWRWILFDLDWAFHNDTNSYSDWLNKEGCGLKRVTDNTLFRELMANDSIKDYFLTKLGERMANEWSSAVIIEKVNARQALLEPEMPATYTRWGNSLERWYSMVDEMRAYAASRPSKLVGYIAKHEKLSDAEIEKYFGEALRANPGK